MSAENITVIAELIFKAAISDTVQEALKTLVAHTRNEEGCIEYVPHIPLDGPSRILFVEKWASKEALDEHLETEHLAAFREIMADYLADAPRITLWKAL